MAIKKNTKKKPKRRKPFPPFSESVWRSRVFDADLLANDRMPIRRVRYENELDTDPTAEIVTKIEHKPVQAKPHPKAPDKSLYLEKLLKKEGIKDFAKDIRLMTRKELLTYFSFKESGKLNVTCLVKNLIWQTYTWIKQGKMPLIEGNIRSFWYISVKPVLSRLGLSISSPKYPEKVYDAFVEMVTVHRLFKYADLGFLDEREHARTIGHTNGNLILFVEKDGLFAIVKRLASQYDITGIALGGFPSYLTTEFLVRDIAKNGLAKKSVRIFSIVDYDPSGYWIEREFVQQLKAFGLNVVSIHSLVDPKELPKDLVEVCKYRLKKGAKTQNWLNAIGGIGGQAFGLESDAIGGKQIEQAFDKAARPYLKATPQQILGKERDELFESLTKSTGRKAKGIVLLPSLNKLASMLDVLSANDIIRLRKLVES